MLNVKSPIDGTLIFERALHSRDEWSAALARAQSAQRRWSKIPLSSRQAVSREFASILRENADAWGAEITECMGRPIRYTPGELKGAADRADTMVDLSDAALSPIKISPKEGFERSIKRVPLGVVLVVPAWNYPYLIAVNAVIPALLAGNAVVIKHSEQSAMVGDRFAEAWRLAVVKVGFDNPEDIEVFSEHLLRSIHTDHAGCAEMIADSNVNAVAFTGSTTGGHAISQAAAERFIPVGLELGGKDPAYVRADADVKNAAANLADGAFFNSGQSCCGVERIYVHESVYDAFVSELVAETMKLVVGDPRESSTTIGPMAKLSGAETVRSHIAEAVAAGAKSWIDAGHFGTFENANFVAPQVLTEVTHEMRIMREETFGPVACVMKVADDDEALAKMNDSQYGLTASIWTQDLDAARVLAESIETGTVFVNRCDFLDPELAWVGVKDSGRGCTLSVVGFESMTRPKSFHFRLPEEN